MLELHDATVSIEDANLKFLRSLPSVWHVVATMIRGQPGLDELDFDDLYNNLKVYEHELKGVSNSNSQNIAFLSTEVKGSTLKQSTVKPSTYPKDILKLFSKGANAPTVFLTQMQIIFDICYDGTTGVEQDDRLASVDAEAHALWTRMGLGDFWSGATNADDLHQLSLALMATNSMYLTVPNVKSQKETVFNTENSEESFQNRSPNSQNSVGQESRTKGLGNKGGTLSKGRSFFPSASTFKGWVDKVLFSARPKMTQTVPSKSTANVTYQDTARSRVPQAVLSRRSNVGSQAVKVLPQTVKKECNDKSQNKTMETKRELLDYSRIRGNGILHTSSNMGNPGSLKDYAIQLSVDALESMTRRQGQVRLILRVQRAQFNLLFYFSYPVIKKHNVLFTDKDCLILSPKFKFVVEDWQQRMKLSYATEDWGMFNFKIYNKWLRRHSGHLCKKIEERTVREPLELLHMDLFGPVSVESINKKKYCLVVTDDCSKFSWVCDHGTEFKNQLMNEFCAKKGIERESSIARGLHSKMSSLVTKPQLKTPYEILMGRSPNISFMRPFGCSLTILNTLDHLGKFDGKSEEGYLLDTLLTVKGLESTLRITRKICMTNSIHVHTTQSMPPRGNVLLPKEVTLGLLLKRNKRRISIAKGKEHVDSNFNLSTPNTPPQSTGYNYRF
ncbi:putative ribonuclease H-like domain-containing protein [Tanacetum coccineum]|uniref:Ribonuclease H-like domain-containing protein n=1 Tax=Tanacetum coccineum TaxID=301880 RepID=A0ABQ5I7E7_9ASTR